ncbi:MAG TPA: 16S rRNA (cytosine(967)-C(5))-methyltransferase RsmB [Steroidobacteraceae bacterium]|nr:16S rRNA (cytosine(967)-C(5))-methyltransferase RsmB [Steroidobacteraceae bacterium]
MARSPWAPGAPAIAAAARILEAVVARGESADAALGVIEGTAERGAVRAIALGSIRWYLRLAPAIEPLLTHPAGVSATVRALLVVAAHQVEYSRHAKEMSVHAAVDATRVLGCARAAGLVNAVLRRFVSDGPELLRQVDRTSAGRTAHPAWLVEELARAWPAQCDALLAANNERPPMTLRVDLTRSSVPDYLSRLAAASIDAHEIQSIPSAVTLNQPMAVADLPGFADGVVSIQDAGAQLAAPLLDARPGMRTLDACAAPGGKIGHLLEQLGPGADLVALDVDAARVGLIRENLTRLGRAAQVIVGDIREPASFWDGRPFDRILVDAPCSSSGVIRRHPDIKLLRRPTDIPSFAELQLGILRAALGVLAPGGRLLYCTCSVLPLENQVVVSRLLALESGVRLAPMPRAGTLALGALEGSPGVQLLPGAEAGTDGFYYACLEKTTGGTWVRASV